MKTIAGSYPTNFYDAFDLISDYISDKASTPLNEMEQLLIEQSFHKKRLRKHQYFLQEGDTCRYMGFIVKGNMRMLSVNERGIEHTIVLGMEQSWICDHESFHTLSPSIYNIQALEDTELLTITQEKLQYLSDEIPAVAKAIKNDYLRQLIKSQQRVHSTFSLNAEERYEQLLLNEPTIAERFSLANIASYLGITPETLSRVRKQVLSRL